MSSSVSSAKPSISRNGIGLVERLKIRMNRLSLYLMILPAFLLLLVFKYWPMYGLVMSFQDYQPFLGISGSHWVGWSNFEFLFHSPDTLQVIRNTLMISLYRLIFGFPAPIIFALLLNEIRLLWYKRTAQTLVYLPHFMSWVIIGGVLLDFLSPSNGLLNKLIGLLGGHSIFFLGDNHWFRFSIVVSDIWKEFGFGAIVYLAAIAGINPHLYEAAVIDGAGKWKQMLFVTLPALLPTIVVLLVLRLGHILDAGFEQIFVMYNPAVYSSGDIIDTYVYREGLVGFQYSIGAAVGLLKSFVGLILIVLSYAAAYRYSDYRVW